LTRPPEEESFLSRWARRKAQEQEQPAELRQPEAPEPEGEANDAPGEAQGSPAETAEAAAERLPDPETLGRDDDWSPFLKAEVPKELRVRALRRLWRLDPVFANLDGLVDYAEDYNSPEFTGRPVKTLFQVGRGMLVQEEAETREAEETEEGPPADDSPEVEEATDVPGQEPTATGDEGESLTDGADAKATASEDASEADETVEARTEGTASPALSPFGAPPFKASGGRSAIARRWGFRHDRAPREE